jgi:hypothetical protein
VTTVGLLAVGCGAGTSIVHTTTRAAPRTIITSPATPAPLVNPNAPLPTPGPTGIPAAADAVRVIRGWSDALRRGDVAGAAGYFAFPSVMINGSDASGSELLITIDTPSQAAAANATLPCGALLISADRRGRYVNALFRLTGRPGLGGSGCDGGVGQTARTNFVITHGRIVEWIRAPDDPGDNRAPRGQPSPSPAPAPGLQPTPKI